MGKELSLTGKIVREYLSREKKKEPKNRLSKKALAKLIYKENVEVFSSVEHTRGVIRYHTGQLGYKSRSDAVSKEFWDMKREIPESLVEEWRPFVIPKAYKNLLVLSDIHVPYHERDAVWSAVHYGKENGCDAVLLNGDVMDFYQLSRYDKDPRKRGFEQEIKLGREFFAWLRSMFDCPIYFKLGNHEERYQAYLRKKAPELLEVPEWEMGVLLKCGENKIEVIDDKRIIKFGNLNILHGHEFQSGFSSPINPARTFLMKMNANVLCGHVHRSSTHREKVVGGRPIQGFTTGCLCELEPEYARINKYTLGFARVERLEEDNVRVHNLLIDDGEVIYS
tara:strand:+ start:2989 stop:3999 length:1011 start_codon:yes stop_codon:yes gene_type:complete